MTKLNDAYDELGILSKKTGVRIDVVADYSADNTGTTDTTTAIQNAINSASTGSTIYFPPGTYKITGLTIGKPLYLVGENMTETMLVNTSTNDAITINNNSDTWGITNLMIQGNSSTTGNGLTLLHAFNGYIRNVWFLGNKIGLYFAGDNNSIEIDMCRFQQNYVDGIRGYGTSALQINDIRISKSNIQKNTRSGVNIWGISISIRDCAIQGNQMYGVELNSANQTSNNTCLDVSVRDNYFEGNQQGSMYFKGVASTSNVITGLVVDGNYGVHENVTGTNAASWSASAVLFDNTSTNHNTNRGFRNVYWGMNHFTQERSSGGAIDFGGNLGSDSVIVLLHPTDQAATSLSYLNKGATTKLGAKQRYINGLNLAKGTITYSTINQSDNFTSSGSYVIFPIALKDGAWLNENGFQVNCNSTNYSLTAQLIEVDANGTATNLTNDTRSTLSGNYTYTFTNMDFILSGSYAYFLKVTFTFTNAPTSCTIGNPYLIAND